MHVLMNFKGFKHAFINLFNPLTVLIGPNGSGKSNLIEGVELLAFLVHGRPLHEIYDIGRGTIGGLEIRGGFNSCARHGENSFTLGLFASINFKGKMRPFKYLISLNIKEGPGILSEELVFTDDDTLIFTTLPRTPGKVSSDIQVKYNNFAPGGRKPRTSASGEVSVISQYDDFAKSNKRYPDCVKMVSGIKNWLQSSFAFDPNPKMMRNYERIGKNTLLRNGANLSAVLYGLHVGDEKQRESLERIIDWIRQLPEEPFGELDFVTTPLNDVIFGFRESHDGSFLDARSISDGTLRCLAVLTAIETVADNSRVVIEEVDNGLHPSRVRVLLDAIVSCCKRKELNVLITTHNPATLNTLGEEQLSGVVFCVWNSKDKAFDLLQFKEIPRHDELLERGRLGDLVTRRLIEQYLIPEFEENKKEEALKWLESLKL